MPEQLPHILMSVAYTVENQAQRIAELEAKPATSQDSTGCESCAASEHRAQDWKLSWEKSNQECHELSEARSRLAEKNFELERENETLKPRIAELEAQLADQQPQTDEQLQSRVATMTRLLHEQGYGLRDIDPTAEDANIKYTRCGRYFDGGCLLHGVPPEVADQSEDEVEDDNEPHASEADLAQQQAAADDPYAGEDEPTQEECDALYQALKDGTAYVVDDNGNPMKVKFPEDEDEPVLDPAAPHGGSDGRPYTPPRHPQPEVEEAIKTAHEARRQQGEEGKEHIFSPWYKKDKSEEPKEDPRDKLMKDLQARLAEAVQLKEIASQAKDKLVARNRELEAENDTLKTQLAELRAKLAQYEGIA